jgi:hypothetical protein
VIVTAVPTGNVGTTVGGGGTATGGSTGRVTVTGGSPGSTTRRVTVTGGGTTGRVTVTGGSGIGLRSIYHSIKNCTKH